MEDCVLTAPTTPAEWDAYYDLRWRVLREPWAQSRGSERDDQEETSIHVMLCNANRRPLAVGRLHFPSPCVGQVRYMAVEPDLTGRGYGGRVLQELERQAVSAGATRMILNAREPALAFYFRHGYRIVAPGETLFGSVKHLKMEKTLQG
jgi:GNAT superfamily N-acetyltransferase